ncbi:MAG: thermonuclease family protein [Alphaproteobacteria bacterium]|nr:thermonuclease family protein [Alphaproteobacteria bacterium]
MYLNVRKTLVLLILLSIVFLIPIKFSKSSDLKIIDGDTIQLDGKKIRFNGIDAPELNQKCKINNIIVNCGKDSRTILVNKILNNKPNCIIEGLDIYQRSLAECFINNESLSSYLVKNGYAFAYRKYSKKFISDEDYARINRIGMWSMEFEFPWEFRKKN